MKRLKTEDDVPAGKLKKDCGKQLFFCILEVTEERI
jgi:hypothetical protein